VQKLKNLVDESNEKEDVRKRKMTLEYEINEAAQERAEKMAVGMAEQLAAGMAEKLTAERLETAIDNRLFENARNLIQAGVSIDVIAKSLGLSMEQLTQLKENL
jgi:hypothetical protein